MELLADGLPAVALAPRDAALHNARTARVAASRAEFHAMEWALSFCDLNSPDAGMGTPPAQLDHVHDIPLGGEGAPLVAESAVAEFAAAMDMSPLAARSYLADALELAHRLPRLWERLRAGEVPVYRARMVAARTAPLPRAAAEFVDREVAGIAGTVGSTRLMRLVERAFALFDPAEAEARATAAAEQRDVQVCCEQAVDGVVDVLARLDHADALDLETALQAVAAELKEAGDADPLAVRRSKALGEIARRAVSGAVGGARRRVQIYLHLGGRAPEMEGSASTPTVEQIAGWCSTGKVRITPVLDLNAEHHGDGYAPSETVREHVVLTDTTCVFPGCTRSARRCDLDHIVPWEAGGTTSTDNLAPLCRAHHRLKTHAGWQYQRVGPGSYRWTSPLGRTYEVQRR